MITLKYLVNDDVDREKIVAALISEEFHVAEETREKNGKIEHLVCVEVDAEVFHYLFTREVFDRAVENYPELRKHCNE